MATVSGNLGVVKVGGNQVAEIKSFDITETDNIIEDTGMGDSFKSFVSGIKEATGTITCHFDRTDSTGQEAMLVGANVTLDLFPEGGQSGERQIQASVVITSVGVSQTINEIVERSFGFQATGGVTHSTVS